MKPSEYDRRMEWARSLTVPACVLCMKQFSAEEPVIRIAIDGGKHMVYFHAGCYDIVADQSRRAMKVFHSMVLGFMDWSTGSIEIDRIAPFRPFLPGKLSFGGDLE